MNLKNPLAAALLMTASAAMSQTLVLPTSSGFGPQTAPFSPTLPGDTDMVEKCSTVPYRLCTTQELNFREIRKGGGCAEKDFACQRKLMENTGSAPLQLLGNQSNPSTANDEFFKKCGTVPYRLCTSDEQKKRDAWLASKKPENKKPSADPKGEPTTVDEIVVTGRRYDQEPGFIGPPAPPDRPSAPPAMTDAQFKAGFEVVQNTYPDAIDLGDHRYGLPKKDGTIEVCSQGGCETRPQSEFSDQIQQANAERRNYTGSSGGGMSMTSTPNTAPKGTGGAVAGNDPAGDTPPTTPTGNGGSRSPGRDQGAEVFANQESMGDRKSTRLNSSHIQKSRMPSSA